MKHFKAGVYRDQIGYKSFSPSLINKSFDISDKQINLLLEEASRAIGQLNAYSDFEEVNMDLFINMHIYKEATLSNKIEGTQTTMDEAVKPEELVVPEKRDDWQEIQNYTKAIHFAQQELLKLPVSIRLITDTHAILLKGVRGEHKNPGEIRKSQNWIGGSSPSNAFFVPPHYEELPELLSDLEKFWHNDTLQIPTLIKIAIFHYQFETLHPFCDGNGRMGRLLIPLMLMSCGVLTKPALYISSFFESNKGRYYDSLTKVRTQNDLGQWIKFFLTGVITTAKNGTVTLKKLIAYRNQINDLSMTLGARAKKADEVIKWMFGNPVANTKKIAEQLHFSYGVANRLLGDLEKLGILNHKVTISNAKYYELKGYLDLFK